MSATPIYIIAVILAIAIDFLLVRRMRRHWQQRKQGEQETKLFGYFSPVLTWLKYRRLPTTQGRIQRWIWHPTRLERYLIEWLLILVVAYMYCGSALLDFDANRLQQTGEHNESATLPLLTEISVWRYGEIPLWNPYMQTGFPLVGDLLSHFWNPVSTLPILIWGGINGMKVSVFISFFLAGIGQWLFAHIFGARGWVRLWASLLYMLSGGLALLWRVGWYELLLGIAWFPWCFASLWWALHRRDRTSLVLTAVCIAMVLTTGGGYYPFYLLVCLSVLLIIALIGSRSFERQSMVWRALAIAGLSAGLVAVMLVPLLDSYRYAERDVGLDLEQNFSQPIVYALINYVVSEPEWFRTQILGTASGWNWFYIGYLPLAALALVPLAFSRSRRRRLTLGALGVLTLVLLAWHANRFTPFKYIYDSIPFLYNLRFPNRLLIVATSPLLVMGGLGLQALSNTLWSWSRSSVIAISKSNVKQVVAKLPMKLIWQGLLVLVLLFSVKDVYTINQEFAFAPVLRNPKPTNALSWLKSYDPSLYYTNIGGGAIYWDWTPAAYELEMPIINFVYSRRLTTFGVQRLPGSPFFATPKYMLALPDQSRPDNAVMLKDFDGVGLWLLPDALPFAFSVSPARLQSGATLTPQDVSALNVHLDGPNRVVVIGASAQPGDQLVVLVSNYPGWRLFVDGRPMNASPVNYYLGAQMLPGEHIYTFAFSPVKYYVGLGISLLTLLIVLGLVAMDVRLRYERSKPRPSVTDRAIE